MTSLAPSAARGITLGALNTLATMAASDVDEFKAALRLAAESGKTDGGVFEFVAGLFAEAILAKIDKGDSNALV